MWTQLMMVVLSLVQGAVTVGAQRDLYSDIARAVCVDGWKIIEGTNVVGADPKPAVSAIEECRADCLQDPNCIAFDWNSGYVPSWGSRCWFHTLPYEQGAFRENDQQNHFIRCNEESSKIANAVCEDGWKIIEGYNVVGADPRPAVSAVEECKVECRRDPKCIAFDWNFDDVPFQGSRCWIHTLPYEPAALRENVQVNHMIRCNRNDEFRLVGGDNEASGRVEVYHDNEWGTVCAHKFYQYEADMLCRSLGYRGGADSFTDGGNGDGTIWLTEVICPSNASSITECSHKDWGDSFSFCGHWYDLMVVCNQGSTTPEIEFNLVGGDNEANGWVEVVRDGVRGTICGDHFLQDEADMVCRSLGFSGGAELFRVNGNRMGNVMLEYINCPAEANSIADCNHSGWQAGFCDGNDASVSCSIAQGGTEGE